MCVIFLSPIVDVITLSFFALLHTVGALCLQNAFHWLMAYDLNGFKSRVNRHSSFIFPFPLFSFTWVLFLTLRRMESCDVICFFSEYLENQHFVWLRIPHPIFFCYTCNTKFGMKMPDTYGHVIGGGRGGWRISELLPDLNLAIISEGIGVKILEAVDWLKVLNKPSHLKSAAGTRISCS